MQSLNSDYSVVKILFLFETGIPDFIQQPPSTLDITEGSNLQLRIEMDGNPQPSADFKWPHLTGSSPTNVPSVQLYPFVYSSTYTLNTIDASYCGRILQTTLKNSIGSSSVKSTKVTVLRKFSLAIVFIGFCFSTDHLLLICKLIQEIPLEDVKYLQQTT